MAQSKPKPPTGKQTRRELARKKARRNKQIAIIVFVVAVVTVTTLITYTVIQNRMAEVYSDGEQTIWLRPDGRFRVRLAQEKSFRGSYTGADEGGVTVITFSYGKETAVGQLIIDQLYLPAEWDDGDGHIGMLTKQ